MPQVDQALEYVRANREDFINRYLEFLAIPSISTLPENRDDVRRNAEWLAGQLDGIGAARAEVFDTPGHPVVYAERLDAAGKPTLLVYGHYDVQPVDPLDEWESDPFKPERRGDNVYARGASDMKGSMMAVIMAAEAFARQGEMPVNLKFLFEGEEEVGSPNLADFIRNHRELLKADAVLNCDGSITGPDQPSITYSLRGLAYFELEVRGPRQDLHSGVFGGSIANPAAVLCELVAGMHDENGRVTLPGFYDSVRPLDEEERSALARLPVTDEKWLSMTGAPALYGEDGYTTLERLGARPTLEINGLVSGFTGEGAKTVLPARAVAKISMRLVADQDYTAIHGQFRAYLEANAPDTVTWELRELTGGPGAIMARDSAAMKAAVAALRETFGAEPIFRREGGSVPVVGHMQHELDMDSVLLGFGLPDDNIHGPNEKQHLPTLLKGVETYVRLLAHLGG